MVLYSVRKPEGSTHMSCNYDMRSFKVEGESRCGIEWGLKLSSEVIQKMKLFVAKSWIFDCRETTDIAVTISHFSDSATSTQGVYGHSSAPGPEYPSGSTPSPPGPAVRSGDSGSFPGSGGPCWAPVVAGVHTGRWGVQRASGQSPGTCSQKAARGEEMPT